MRGNSDKTLSDKRHNPRVTFGFTIEEADGDALWMVDNISRGGCFLRPRAEKPVGSSIELVFRLPGSVKRLRVNGVVRHVHDRGMGVEFVSMDDDGRQETDRFVRDFYHEAGTSR
jgi:uncharacterized protein (TIGR02266 family)